MESIRRLAEEEHEVEATAESIAQVEWWKWLVLLILVFLSACYSGLNLGVMGLDVQEMEMMIKGPFETKEEEIMARHAKRLLPLRRRGNLLLCAIHIGNTLAVEYFSILMEGIAGGLIAIITTTLMIVILGEIFPQALMTRHGIKAGSFLSPILYLTVGVTFVVAFPIAAILDKVLGEEAGAGMTRKKMKQLLEMQVRNKMIEGSEGKILKQTLDLSKRQVDDVMINIEDVYMLELNKVINRDVCQEIYSKGFSRIPIYDGERQNICGVLMAKDLILFNPDRDQMTIKQMSSSLRDSVNIDNTTSCLRVLSQFRLGTTHMAMVTKIENDGKTDPYLRKIGLITLEDIIEQVIGEEIEDEFQGDDGTEERRLQKEQLLALFTDRKASKLLHENELKAIIQFLSIYVTPFKADRLRSSILETLVNNSEVLIIESDSRSFTHNTNQFALLKVERSKIKKIPAEKNKYENDEHTDTDKILLKPKTDGDQIALMAGMVTERGEDEGEINEDEINEEDNQALTHQQFQEKEIDQLREDGYVFNPVLFTRGIESDAFYLILGGKVEVCSGNEGFMIMQSSFNYLGADSLIRDDYKPDFSAKVIEHARVLRITRTQYRKAISNIAQTKPLCK